MGTHRHDDPSVRGRLDGLDPRALFAWYHVMSEHRWSINQCLSLVIYQSLFPSHPLIEQLSHTYDDANVLRRHVKEEREVVS